jgi:predicted PurR-regulated permease PerM
MAIDRSGIKTLYILLASFAAFLVAGYFLRHTFSAILTSLVIAYLCNPLLKYLEKKGFDRFTALTLLYGIAALASLIASFFLIPYFLHQIESLFNALPHYVQSIKTALEEWKIRMAPYYAEEEGTWLLEQAEEYLALLAQDISGTGYRHVTGLFFGVFDLILAPILVFLILYYKEFFKEIITRMVPPSESRHLTELGKKINRSLERFILGMVLDCLIVGTLSATALYFLGIEFPLINGLFAGFACLVPFLGMMIAVIPAALIGYAKNGDIYMIPRVVAIYFLIHVIIEGNLIKPLVMKRTLRLNPLAVIFSVMAMGELLGFWGIVLAVPLAAVINICAGEVRELVAADGSGHGKGHP